MKKGSHFYLLLLFLLIAEGCTVSPARFNETYLKTARPDQPAEQIAFQSAVNDEIENYLSKPKFSNNVELYWRDADNLYLNLEGKAVYAVYPASRDVRKLEGAEEQAAVEKMARKVNIANVAQDEGLATKITSYLFSNLGQKYTGEIFDNNNKIQVFAILKEGGRDNVTETPCESASLEGKLSGLDGRETAFKWNYNCDWLPQKIADYKVPQIFKKVYVSPSGKYYLYGSLLYDAAKKGAPVDLMSNDPGVISIAVNPAWSKIAVLRGAGHQYRIEFLDLKVEDINKLTL